ncbi:outer membrane protein assembly factor BamC [Parasalinivibrio latis]|uniref:outer membrane protein assembly factor BamC n=1 Tax=Parasalinivibrio latis TaxID=2952610 RepID=UPI0030E384D9
MKLSYRLGLCAIVVAALSACSGGASQRRQAQNDFDYLETPGLEAWHTLPGQEFVVNRAYEIPDVNATGAVGSGVDIRPPQQVLALIPGARADVDERGVTLWLAQPGQMDTLWPIVSKVLKDDSVSVEAVDNNELDTGWYVWSNEDDDSIAAKYRITRLDRGELKGLRVAMTGWREGNSQSDPQAIYRDRYTALMTNLITAGYDDQMRENARLEALKLVKQIPISMGKDRGGLPVIIARAPYEVFWERLPDVLGQLGFTVEDRNRSQGTVEVKYSRPDDEVWEKLGIQPLDMGGKKFTLQLGDLTNRTSVSVADSDGKPLPEETLSAVSRALAAAIEVSQSPQS